MEVCADADGGVAHGIAVEGWARQRVDQVGEVLVADGEELAQPSDFGVALLDFGWAFGLELLLLLLDARFAFLQLFLQD